MKIDLKGISKEQLEQYLVNMGEKKFRAKQIYDWIYKYAKSIDDIKNISNDLKVKLNENFSFTNLKIKQKLISKIDGTRKYLFELDDLNVIESVMMEYKHGVSVCLSTQVGCKMGCTFCASGLDGLKRNLKASEILDQVLKIQEDIGKRVSNIVLMGTGEPLDNYDEVLKFLRLINDKNGLNIGYRHITLSTCGLVREINKLAEEKLPINLAISLHSCYDENRKKIMPIARKYSIKELIDACKDYINVTNRRVTFEYALIENINDNKEDALKLSKLLKNMLSHVNLIPVNNVDENNYKRPNKKRIEEFKNTLINNNIEVTIRREMGKDINGACGQLRRSNS